MAILQYAVVEPRALVVLFLIVLRSGGAGATALLSGKGL